MQLHSYSSQAPLLQRRAPARRPISSRSAGGRSAGSTPSRSAPTAPAALATPATSAKSDGRVDGDLEAPAETRHHSGRRHALFAGAAAAFVTAVVAPPAARADDSAAETAAPAPPAPPTATTTKHPRVYLDVRVDGEPAGRIEIELLPELAPVGAMRFADLAEEKGGVGYKLAKWDGIFLEKGYIRCGGARSLSYSADGVSGIAGGGSTLDLEKEMDAQERRRAEAGTGGAGVFAHDRAGLVSLVVREAEVRPVKERLVAVGGKLVTLSSQAGEAPNGSAFTITLGAAPALDGTNLIVGRLVPGSASSEATVAALAALPVNMPREGINRPFFEAGKAMGDSRAIVAERGFYRPLRRAIISDGGELLE